MLEIGLGMLVKNEAANIVACLEPILDIFTQVAIMDTGSSDGTCELLRERFGIEPLHGMINPRECHALAPHRNRVFSMLRTPWILTLDADERIDRASLQAVLALDDAALPAGMLCAWETDLGPAGTVDDYKLCIFRRGHRHLGLVHDTAQPSLREQGQEAIWCPQLAIRHVPPLHRVEEKRAFYGHRLACAQKREPHWLRYHWFMGYMHFQQGRFGPAVDQLRQVHEARPERFPVESLNASMVLADIHARAGDRPEVQRVLEQAITYHRRVRDDFEVRVNFRMAPWLEEAAGLAAAGRLDAIRIYPFAY